MLVQGQVHGRVDVSLERNDRGEEVSDVREQHAGAVHSAIESIGEIQDLLAMATERCEMAMGAVVSATGSTQVESARAAVDSIAGCKDRIQEIHGMMSNAVDELRRYSEGF
jgi:hypothetical protein